MAFDFTPWIPPPDPGWELCEREGKACGTSAGRVVNFKRAQGIPRDQPLSDAARALLLLELETDRTVRKGQALARSRALALIAERATAEAAAALASVLPDRRQIREAIEGLWIFSEWDAEAYLLNRVEALTGKGYATAGAAWQKAAALAPAAAPAAEPLKPDRFRRILFWGVILRLDQLEGPPPADPAAFYRWCQLEAYRGHHSPGPSLGDLLTGRMGEREARALLLLPESGTLEGSAIRSAYRAQARSAHPDAGGDRQRFERLGEARDRLLVLTGTAQGVAL